MNPLKKYYETLIILGGMATTIVSSCFWLNGKFEKVNDKFESMNVRFESINERFSGIEKDITIIKTVLIMKDIMPKDFLAAKEEIK